MIHARRTVALQRERNAAEYIPYTAHVAERVVCTGSGDYLQAFRLGGASFESADDEQLNNWHERLNVLWRNLASPDLALWTHVIRRRERTALRSATHSAGFAQTLGTRYASRLAGETLMVNELYLAVLFRPAAGLAAGLVGSVLSRARRRDRPLDLNQALETCAKLAQTVLASLARYDPEPLGVYRCGNTWCSTLIGEREVLRPSVSRSQRPFDLLPVVNRSESSTVEAAVMASEIEQLPDLAGYLKLASRPQWLQVTLEQPAPARTWAAPEKPPPAKGAASTARSLERGHEGLGL